MGCTKGAIPRTPAAGTAIRDTHSTAHTCTHHPYSFFSTASRKCLQMMEVVLVGFSIACFRHRWKPGRSRRRAYIFSLERAEAPNDRYQSVKKERHQLRLWQLHQDNHTIHTWLSTPLWYDKQCRAARNLLPSMLLDKPGVYRYITTRGADLRRRVISACH